jgi:hypothetical protein
MNKGIILAGVLMLLLVIVWIAMLSLASNRDCPETLPSSYYYCEVNEDCFFHPKYDCISQQLSCVITEDLSARQQAQSLLECVCIDNECVTRVRQQ